MFTSVSNNRTVELENVSGDSFGTQPRSVVRRSDQEQMDSGFWHYNPYQTRTLPTQLLRESEPTFAHDSPRSSTSRDTASASVDGGMRNLKSWFSREKERNKKKSQPNGTSDQTSDKMKTKFISMWNNMKYDLTSKIKPNFSRETPIWLLGQCYQNEKVEPTPGPIGSSEVGTDYREFQQDFNSRIWLTYRKEFQELDGSSLTTDCGWGCMLRSGQMLLAEGLVRYLMGREWRYKQMEPSHGRNYTHRQIIRWFGDAPDDNSPFALHHLVAIGKSMGKKAGDWYGPASVAHILKHAIENAAKKNPLLGRLHIYVAQDCTIYKDDVMKLCTGSAIGGEVWDGVIIFVPVRLGGESFNCHYSRCIRDFLADKNCLGIIGGRPKHSLYFVGWQDDKLIHLDPHYCQEVVDVSKEDFPVQSFHCLSPRKMAFSRMDPSCTIGFYCSSKRQFDALIDLSTKVISDQSQYPIFVVADGCSENYDIENEIKEEIFVCRNYRLDSNESELDSEEEFVMI